MRDVNPIFEGENLAYIHLVHAQLVVWFPDPSVQKEEWIV